MLDLYFHYRAVGRHILMLKYNEHRYNNHTIIKLKKISVFFDLRNLTDLDDLVVSNCFYFIRFFLGKGGYYQSYSMKFKLNIYYHSFLVKCDLDKRLMYYSMFFFLNDIKYTKYLKVRVKEKEISYWTYEVDEMYYFSEKYKKIGFFFLNKPVYFRFYTKYNNYFKTGEFLNLFKI